MIPKIKSHRNFAVIEVPRGNFNHDEPLAATGSTYQANDTTYRWTWGWEDGGWKGPSLYFTSPCPRDRLDG
ncbi:hypothetical protein CEXT_804901 [Caerostris extrusa]|uniref:Uncharacterized protein n=1 Tax=Caerostris extrusa TaxID=172846 RepID=A0AAV4X0Q2_CAEEX|nr:hypothetical protein CEXT_804901 [Caerostris extrusa]